MTQSLFFRLMGAFALVIVAGYSLVYIIAMTDNSRRGQQATASELANGIVIRVDRQTVGTLLTDASALNMGMDASSQDFLNQVNRSNRFNRRRQTSTLRSITAWSKIFPR